VSSTSIGRPGSTPSSSTPRSADSVRRPILELDGDLAVAAASHGGGLGARAQVDAGLRERGADLLGRERLLVEHDPLGRLDEGDPRAQRCERAGHLDADRSSAEDHQARGGLVGVGRLAVGPRLGLAQALDRRQQGA
jgi:hypothetical protein